MKLPATRFWRAVLAAVAVLALGWGVMIGLGKGPAAIVQKQASSGVPSTEASTGSATGPQAVQTAGPATPSPPGPPPSLQEPALVYPPALPTASTPSADLSRLRARSLAIPVAEVSAAQLSDTYTQARAGGAPHDAMDIMAARGTPVLAVEDGRVAKLFVSKPGGITLYQFDPGGEYAYYYAHLDRYADGVAEGTLLRKGQVIGYVGSTGNASPDAPHLHFAIFRLGPERQWWRGTPLNPFLVWRDSRP